MKGLDEMMKQAQAMQKQMQERMEKMKEEQKQTQYTGESGAGLVRVVINGNFNVCSLNLDDSLLKEDKELIEDLIAAATNDALRQVQEAQKQSLGDLGAGLGAGFEFPKDFKFPF